LRGWTVNVKEFDNHSAPWAERLETHCEGCKKQWKGVEFLFRIIYAEVKSTVGCKKMCTLGGKRLDAAVEGGLILRKENIAAFILAIFKENLGILTQKSDGAPPSRNMRLCGLECHAHRFHRDATLLRLLKSALDESAGALTDVSGDKQLRRRSILPEANNMQHLHHFEIGATQRLNKCETGEGAFLITGKNGFIRIGDFLANFPLLL